MDWKSYAIFIMALFLIKKWEEDRYYRYTMKQSSTGEDLRDPELNRRGDRLDSGNSPT